MSLNRIVLTMISIVQLSCNTPQKSRIADSEFSLPPVEEIWGLIEGEQFDQALDEIFSTAKQAKELEPIMQCYKVGQLERQIVGFSRYLLGLDEDREATDLIRPLYKISEVVGPVGNLSLSCSGEVSLSRERLDGLLGTTIEVVSKAIEVKKVKQSVRRESQRRRAKGEIEEIRSNLEKISNILDPPSSDANTIDNSSESRGQTSIVSVGSTATPDDGNDDQSDHELTQATKKEVCLRAGRSKAILKVFGPVHSGLFFDSAMAERMEMFVNTDLQDLFDSPERSIKKLEAFCSNSMNQSVADLQRIVAVDVSELASLLEKLEN